MMCNVVVENDFDKNIKIPGMHITKFDWPCGCNWKEDENGVWWTECSHGFVVNEGTPSENDFKFCPYCGKNIIEHIYDWRYSY